MPQKRRQVSWECACLRLFCLGRYLMVSGDEEVKLLLEAFQMSVSACLSHPQTPVLRAQMLGRLMAVNLSASVKVPIPVLPVHAVLGALYRSNPKP